MIELIVYEYLNRVLDVPAYMEMPTNPPDEFVLIEKTGSGLENHLFSAVFAIQSHAESLYVAAALNESVKEVMPGLAEHAEVASCRLNSDYNYTDGSTKDYRYQAVFQIYHY